MGCNLYCISSHRPFCYPELDRAWTLAPTCAAPVFNLAQLARLDQREADARHYWNAYEKLALWLSSGSPTGQQEQESVMGRSVGQLEDDGPAPWGKPRRSTLEVDKKTLTVATYPAGVMTLTQDGEILMMMVGEGHRGTSARGIAIGSQARDLLAQYGPPLRRVEMRPGESWGYDTQRMAFQLRDAKVVSWLLF